MVENYNDKVPTISMDEEMFISWVDKNSLRYNSSIVGRSEITVGEIDIKGLMNKLDAEGCL
jgi:hypothetical protein